MANQQQTYLDLGYDQNGMAIAVKPVLTSANQMDAQTDSGSIGNTNISNVSVSKLITGVISVVANIGNTNVKIDGVNNRITINDGTYDRVLIGYLPGMF
jgi:hypothetical protein